MEGFRFRLTLSHILLDQGLFSDCTPYVCIAYFFQQLMSADL
jgi:hypothetical protein